MMVLRGVEIHDLIPTVVNRKIQYEIEEYFKAQTMELEIVEVDQMVGV